tara:strand:- start:206812 stop:207090 length:279 start_codon:yes stop_codon:yes gene_type:complete
MFTINDCSLCILTQEESVSALKAKRLIKKYIEFLLKTLLNIKTFIHQNLFLQKVFQGFKISMSFIIASPCPITFIRFILGNCRPYKLYENKN